MAGIKNFSNLEILSLIETWRDLNIEGLLDKKAKIATVSDLVMREHNKRGYDRTGEQVRRKIKSLKNEFKKVSIILYSFKSFSIKLILIY